MSQPPGIPATFRLGDGIQRGQVDVSELESEYKVPPPKYRHAVPSAPWPWMEFDQDEADVLPLSPGAQDDGWSRYPTSHFGNWTAKQVNRCRMLTFCKNDDGDECTIHKVDVFKGGKFDKPGGQVLPQKIPSGPEEARKYWDELHAELDPNLRVRALFIENITLNVLKVLGASYDIEPIFFASSANWIPSRYQENPIPRESDHITVVLPFIRAVNNQHESHGSATPDHTPYAPGKVPLTDTKQTIDTQAPLILSEEKILLQDLLAIHMVRSTGTNVIISYHHRSGLQKTTAKRLQSLVQRTGDSVYWQKIYEKSKDPTFVFLSMLWYALYAWDEALEELYAHLSEKLEAQQAKDSYQNARLTREFHKLQAHLLYYQQLLRDFHKSVIFVRDTHNPAMDSEWITDEDRKVSRDLMSRETSNLLSEIERLETQRKIQSDRLFNAMNLVYVAATLSGSATMQQDSAIMKQDSATMKQISYLTMVFLPANLLASVFVMNAQLNPDAKETLPVYIGITFLLTVVTAWVAVALQEHSSFHRGGHHHMERIFWPVVYAYRSIKWMVAGVNGRSMNGRRWSGTDVV